MVLGRALKDLLTSVVVQLGKHHRHEPCSCGRRSWRVEHSEQVTMPQGIRHKGAPKEQLEPPREARKLLMNPVNPRGQKEAKKSLAWWL